MKKILFLVMTVIALNGLFAPLPAHSQDKEAQPIIMPKPKKSDKPRACPGVVYVTLDGTRFHLPKSFFMTFRTMDGKVIDKTTPEQHPAFNCKIQDMGQVKSFFTGFFSANDVGIELSPQSAPFADGYPAQSYYSEFKTMMLERIKQGSGIMMPDGTNKFEWDLAQAYMLPKENAPTLQPDEAAVIRCTLTGKNTTAGLCNGRYFLPEGFFISYTFGRSHFDETDFLLLDQQIRSRVEKLKAKK